MPTHRNTKGKADPVDVHVGNRLRVRRTLLGVSQEKLAKDIGLTFQQIQKYERGMNRISAGRLYQFSKILNVPLDYFFNQFPLVEHENQVLSKDVLDVIRLYTGLDTSVQHSVKTLMKNLHAESMKPKAA